MKSFWYDHKDNTIRGSFINQTQFGLIMVLIIIGCFNDAVCDRLVKLTELIAWTLGISFTVWKGGRLLHERDKIKNNNGNGSVTE